MKINFEDEILLRGEECNNWLSPKPKSCVCVGNITNKVILCFWQTFLADTTSWKISVAATLITFLELFYFFFSFAFQGKIVKVLFSFLEQFSSNHFPQTTFPQTTFPQTTFLLAKNLTNRLIIIITPLVEKVNLTRLVN